MQEDDLSDNFGTYGEVTDLSVLYLCLKKNLCLDCVDRPDPTPKLRVCLHEQEDGCQQSFEEPEQVPAAWEAGEGS